MLQGPWIFKSVITLTPTAITKWVFVLWNAELSVVKTGGACRCIAIHPTEMKQINRREYVWFLSLLAFHGSKTFGPNSTVILFRYRKRGARKRKKRGRREEQSKSWRPQTSKALLCSVALDVNPYCRQSGCCLQSLLELRAPLEPAPGISWWCCWRAGVKIASLLFVAFTVEDKGSLLQLVVHWLSCASSGSSPSLDVWLSLSLETTIEVKP